MKEVFAFKISEDYEGLSLYDLDIYIGDRFELMQTQQGERCYSPIDYPILEQITKNTPELQELAKYLCEKTNTDKLIIDSDRGLVVQAEVLAIDKNCLIVGNILTIVQDEEEIEEEVSLDIPAPEQIFEQMLAQINANDLTFSDGESLQVKFDTGQLTGPMGPKGDMGPRGDISQFYIPEKKAETEKEETNMFSDLKNGFGKADPRQFKLSINGLAVLGQDNKYHTYNPETRELVEVTTGFFEEMKDLLFIMPAVELEVGDVILHQGKPYHITVAKENVVKGINFENATEDTLVGKTNVFGVKYFTKVFNCLGTNNVLGDLASNPMMTYAMMGGSNFDISKIMMLQAMSKGNGIADFSENPMMLMALMGNDSGKDGMSDFMKMQMFSQMNTKKTKKTTKEN